MKVFRQLLPLLLIAASAVGRPPPPPLFRHPEGYPPAQVTWTVNSEVKRVRAVFPHPLLPPRAVLVTDTGLLLTEDTGRTWSVLPEATNEKMGVVTKVAFHPVVTDTFYVSSAARGVWGTTDNGRTFRPIGTKAAGLAADATVDLIIYPGDPSHRTLLAVHGDAAAGMSRSRDGGRTWDVLNPEYHFQRVVGGAGYAPELFFFGATIKAPDVQNFYTCNLVGEYLTELIRDAILTDMVSVSIRPGPTVYVATADNGLYQIRGAIAHDINQWQLNEVRGWASVARTWGVNADVQYLCLYDPAKLGLVLSTNNLASVVTASDGLLVSSFVKEGARLRPNANGNLFYAVANQALYCGAVSDRLIVHTDPSVVQPNPQDDDTLNELILAMQGLANASNAVRAAQELKEHGGDLITACRQGRLVITARVPREPVPPTVVSVDLSRFGGVPDAPLFDDGQHDDGAAGDGLYGLAMMFRPQDYRPRGDDWRDSWPGPVGLSVTATYPDSTRRGTVGVVGVYPQVTSFDWKSRFIVVPAAKLACVVGEDLAAPFTNGVVTAVEKNKKGEFQICHLTMAAPGRWAATLQSPDWMDLTGYHALSFQVTVSTGQPPRELSVQVGDCPVFSDPTTTTPVPVIQEGLSDGPLGTQTRRVVIPFSRLLQDAPQFQMNDFRGIIFSGESTAPGTVSINNVRFIATAEELTGANGGASP